MIFLVKDWGHCVIQFCLILADLGICNSRCCQQGNLMASKTYHDTSFIIKGLGYIDVLFMVQNRC